MLVYHAKRRGRLGEVWVGPTVVGCDWLFPAWDFWCGVNSIVVVGV